MVGVDVGAGVGVCAIGLPVLFLILLVDAGLMTFCGSSPKSFANIASTGSAIIRPTNLYLSILHSEQSEQ